MARLILWMVLIALVARAVSSLLKGVLDGAGHRPSDGLRGVALVRDPVCGVFVVPAEALRVADGSVTRYFCSDPCRRKWIARQRTASSA